jgi:trk system potassium uptake protein TrkA
MYFIIAGCMKIGATLAQMLSQENHDVVVIDSDPNNLEALGNGFNGVTITGMPIDEDVLRSAGIEKADALAAVTRDDNMNVMVAQVAQNIFHVPKVITRLYSPDQEIVFRQMGMTTICPTLMAVNKVKEMLVSKPGTAELSISGTNVAFRTVEATRRLIGKPVAAVRGLRIFGFIKAGTFSFAEASSVIEAGDLLVISELTQEGGNGECLS